ncbi:hypothetical protein [Arthrobacter sp. Y81]|uniref:hypothetical protein n=1 Tax=Arthrobacter sp. Y81 TaxID=2058897 RepID=UPI000CE3C606|nr:hypothetical protein [Arthrobacter sp. Y81]
MTIPRSDPAFYAAEKYKAANLRATPGILASADRERGAVAITLDNKTLYYLPPFQAWRLAHEIADAIITTEQKESP